jgi:hypothetical protein
MSGSEPGAAGTAQSEEAKPGTPKKQGPATKLAIFSRTVLATLILAAAGAIGAGLGHVVIPSSSASTGSGTTAAAAATSPATSAETPSASVAAGPGAPPQAGQISAEVQGEHRFLSVPDPDDSQNLPLSKCYYADTGPGSSFGCVKLDAEPSENHQHNQQWQINSAKLGTDLYVATISSNFSGTINWSKAPGYLADMNDQNGNPDLGSNEGSVGLMQPSEELYGGYPTGHQGAYWILRPAPGGLWQLSPMVTPALCLSSISASSGSWPLELAECATNDDPQQLWSLK